MKNQTVFAFFALLSLAFTGCALELAPEEGVEEEWVPYGRGAKGSTAKKGGRDKVTEPTPDPYADCYPAYPSEESSTWFCPGMEGPCVEVGDGYSEFRLYCPEPVEEPLPEPEPEPEPAPEPEPTPDPYADCYPMYPSEASSTWFCPSMAADEPCVSVGDGYSEYRLYCPEPVVPDPEPAPEPEPTPEPEPEPEPTPEPVDPYASCYPAYPSPYSSTWFCPDMEPTEPCVSVGDGYSQYRLYCPEP